MNFRCQCLIACIDDLVVLAVAVAPTIQLNWPMLRLSACVCCCHWWRLLRDMKSERSQRGHRLQEHMHDMTWEIVCMERWICDVGWWRVRRIQPHPTSLCNSKRMKNDVDTHMQKVSSHIQHNHNHSSKHQRQHQHQHVKQKTQTRHTTNTRIYEWWWHRYHIHSSWQVSAM